MANYLCTQTCYIDGMFYKRGDVVESLNPISKHFRRTDESPTVFFKKIQEDDSMKTPEGNKAQTMEFPEFKESMAAKPPIPAPPVIPAPPKPVPPKPQSPVDVKN